MYVCIKVYSLLEQNGWETLIYNDIKYMLICLPLYLQKATNIKF